MTPHPTPEQAHNNPKKLIELHFKKLFALFPTFEKVSKIQTNSELIALWESIDEAYKALKNKSAQQFCAMPGNEFIPFVSEMLYRGYCKLTLYYVFKHIYENLQIPRLQQEKSYYEKFTDFYSEEVISIPISVEGQCYDLITWLKFLVNSTGAVVNLEGTQRSFDEANESLCESSRKQCYFYNAEKAGGQIEGLLGILDMLFKQNKATDKDWASFVMLIISSNLGLEDLKTLLAQSDDSIKAICNQGFNRAVKNFPTFWEEGGFLKLYENISEYLNTVKQLSATPDRLLGLKYLAGSELKNPLTRQPIAFANIQFIENVTVSKIKSIYEEAFKRHKRLANISQSALSRDYYERKAYVSEQMLQLYRGDISATQAKTFLARLDRTFEEIQNFFTEDQENERAKEKQYARETRVYAQFLIEKIDPKRKVVSLSFFQLPKVALLSTQAIFQQHSWR